MEPNIILKIPEICYISADPSRSFPFPFFFSLSYGYLPKNYFSAEETDNESEGYPKITISGFEKLLTADRIDAFVKKLVISDTDWSVAKSGSSSDIIIKCSELDLDPDFSLHAHLEKFVSDAKKNKPVTLTVSVSNFPGIINNSYIVTANVVYAPWAKSISFSQSPVKLGQRTQITYELDGDGVDKILWQDGVNTHSARSPYVAVITQPTLFTLEVFNTYGVTDRTESKLDVLPPDVEFFKAEKDYFSPGEPINLEWGLVSHSGSDLAGTGSGDIVRENSATVYPTPHLGNRAVTYRLTASGYKGGRPGIKSADVTLTQTNWAKNGTVSGFAPAFNLPGARILPAGRKLYAYAHPKLYVSDTGCAWSELSVNTEVGSSFTCLATECDGNTIYVMGKSSEHVGALYITQYDIAGKTWSYRSVQQSCTSDMGSFAFSKTEKAYAQIKSNGISITRRTPSGQWNGATSVIRADEGITVVGGDYCYYKDRNYAAMLSSEGSLFIYDCNHSMQDYLFRKKVGERAEFAAFIPTSNNLFLLTAISLLDIRSHSIIDTFSPPGTGSGNRPWLGTDADREMCAIFPDKNYWIYL